MGRAKWLAIKQGILDVLAFLALMILSSWLTNLIVPVLPPDQPRVGDGPVKELHLVGKAAAEFQQRLTLNPWVGWLMLLAAWGTFVVVRQWWRKRVSK